MAYIGPCKFGAMIPEIPDFELAKTGIESNHGRSDYREGGIRVLCRMSYLIEISSNYSGLIVQGE